MPSAIRRRLVGALVPALALLLPVAAGAQTSLTVQAGATFASLAGDDAEDLDTRNGLIAGASIAFPLSDVFAVAPGLYYVQKGSESSERVPGLGNVETELGLDYLEIPVLAMVRVTSPHRGVGITLFAGPEIAFEVSCAVDVDIGDTDDDEQDDDSVDCDDDPDSSDRRTVDFGLVVGAGVGFGLTERLTVGVNGGLDLGLRSLDGSQEENDIKNSTWFLMAGLSFPIGG